MPQIGKKNKLTVVKRVDFGMYLDGVELGEILIPNRYVPIGCKAGDILEVFLYRDSEDRLIATTETPHAEVGKCGHLKVVSTSNFGAFMDWGVMKDLLVPFKEQRTPMQVGKSYTVYVYIDNSGRIVGSSKLSQHLKEEDDGQFFAEGQAVNLKIASRSDMGYKVVINDTHLGLIHNSDLLAKISVGDEKDGYIKQIREDGRIDVTLQMMGEEATDVLSKDILEFLKAEGGSSDLTDKSSPEAIYQVFNVSKSAYKKALGKLYKEKRVLLEKNLVKLV
jgi:predicted RNA-binding protein (virulence factor B family)